MKLIGKCYAWGQDPGSWSVCDPEQKWSYDLGHTELEGRLERLYPINRLDISSHNTYMIVPMIFFKLLLKQTNTQSFLS